MCEFSSIWFYPMPTRLTLKSSSWGLLLVVSKRLAKPKLHRQLSERIPSNLSPMLYLLGKLQVWLCYEIVSHLLLKIYCFIISQLGCTLHIVTMPHIIELSDYDVLIVARPLTHARVYSHELHCNQTACWFAYAYDPDPYQFSGYCGHSNLSLPSFVLRVFITIQ